MSLQKLAPPTVPPVRNAPGFYYHYKHDDARGIYDYAYCILGAGLHSEEEIDPRDQVMQVYLPLYESLVYRLDKMFDLRPNEMALESVTRDGVSVPRFSRITDPEIIAKLKEKLREMYPELAALFV